MENTIRLTTAQALIKFLNQQYIYFDKCEIPFVEGIFHILGHGNVLGIGEALEEDPGHLKIFQGKNEQGMAHSAIAFAKQKKRQQIYAVTASSGPGSANMVTAAATAFANNIPVLFLPADIFASRQPDPVLQQMEHENSLAATTNDAFKAVSKYWDRIQRPEQLMSALLRAFEVMTNPATCGPVTISLCQDVEGEAYDYPVDFFKKRLHYIDRQLPNQRELAAAVQKIKESRYPVIIMGGGALYSDAGEELRALSNQCNIPLVGTHAGKSTVSSEFENNLGGMGILGTSAANKIVQQADLVIGIGTRYTDFTTASKTIFDFEKARFLNINLNRMQAYKFDALQVLADAKATLSALLPELTDYQSAFGDQISERKKEWNAERDRLTTTKFSPENFTPEIAEHFSQETLNEYADVLDTKLTQTAVFLKINELVGDEAIPVGSAGSLPGDMQRLWNSRLPNTFHLEYGYSTMGYEVAGALGVKLADPAKEVYALLGDGSFLMLHTELVTALQYHQKINIVLFDNSGYGCINNLQMENGSESLGTELRTDENAIMRIDYAKIAEGYGAKSYAIHTMEELAAAFEDAKKQTTAVLFDIKVLPKTMSHDYDGSWWNTGISEISNKKAIQSAYADRMEMLKKARKY
ncbi:3D-(3,5/4)-trihydroxycyclohexane-1,2-dione acylhydrolase (decyclizing) [Enterococcus hirae]|nr:3D-(3,5/4)-trihydroxycyclohexane-1,2-dione acylhydrolase (decyclizing) [Enterococcus hirae]